MLKATEKLFKIFADKNRLRIFNLLEQRKMCVCELASILEVTQPSISRHLKRMKEVGLVADEQDKFWTNYYLKKNGKPQQDILCCIRHLLKGDKTIQSDLKKLKKVDRTKMCCG